MAFDIDAIRAEFPSLAVHDGDQARVYLDNPAGTQVPRRVIERISDCLVCANSNLGGHFSSSRLAGELVDGAHAAMRDFLNARSTGEIVFGQNTTSLVFHLSRSIGRTLQAGDEIVLTRMDHDANIAPWLMLAEDLGLVVRWWEMNPDCSELELAQLDAVLRERTRLVAVAYASNALGTISDVAGAVQRAHAVGAQVFVDAVQYAPHALIDVQALGCDFLVCSPYKFYGPHQGVLWGRRELLESLTAYRVRPAGDALPHKYETGTLSHESMAGTLGAIEHFAWIGQSMGTAHAASGENEQRAHIRAAFSVLQGHENTLVLALLAGLAALPGTRVLGISNPAHTARRVPTVSFVREQHSPEAMARRLAQHNIFAWNGHNYAVELYRKLGMESEGGLRIGFAQYNTLAEVETTLAVLAAMD